MSTDEGSGKAATISSTVVSARSLSSPVRIGRHFCSSVIAGSAGSLLEMVGCIPAIYAQWFVRDLEIVSWQTSLDITICPIVGLFNRYQKGAHPAGLLVPGNCHGPRE